MPTYPSSELRPQQETAEKHSYIEGFDDDDDEEPRKSVPELAKEHWKLLIGAALGIAATIVLAVERDPLVSAVEPHKQAIINTPASWIVPIAILVVLSIPPLFGHEIVLLIVGLIWGYRDGFLISAVGSLLGELLCFILFRYFFTKKAREQEQKSLYYAALTRVIREANLALLILIRYSYIPGHIITAVQSTTGSYFVLYSLACIASLPKQFALVVLGVQFGISTASGATEDQVNEEKKISTGVTVGFLVLSLIAGRVVRKKVSLVKLKIQSEKKTARQQLRLQQRQMGGNSQTTSTNSLPLSDDEEELVKSVQPSSTYHMGIKSQTPQRGYGEGRYYP